MSTSIEAFEFFEGATTDDPAARITIRRSGQIALTGATIVLLGGEAVSYVQFGYHAATKAVGIRSVSKATKGRYRLRRQANRSGLVNGRRFFEHHGLSLANTQTFDAETFGEGTVGFRLTEPGAASPADVETIEHESKPARVGKRKGT